MTITLFGHPSCLLHKAGEHHPERPARLNAIYDQLIRSGLEFVVQQKDSSQATIADLCRAHCKLYVDDLFAKNKLDKPVWLDPDTQMNEHSLEAALYAAGAAVNAVDQVMSAVDQQAFCAVRPPGHHATRNQAMGFCLFNNIAVAAAYAMDRYNLERVAIVDFDVHHGNGTEDIFADDGRVLFCSSFQHPFYPYSGHDEMPQHIINLPLPAGCRSAQWRAQINEHWFTALDEFAPQLILISAGFDGHAEDEMAQFLLTEDDYCWVTTKLKQLATKHCCGRIVSTLEGGYALSALGRSVVAHLKAML